MAKNKIIYNGNTLIDLTGDTVTADKLMQGYTAHDRSGAIITGTATGGGTGAISVVDIEDTHGGTIRTITAVDISDTTAVAEDVAQGKYFYTADGTKTAGTSTGGGGTPSGGLEYETGTWTPTEDVENHTISFTNTHTVAPFYYLVSDETGTYSGVTATAYLTVYFNYHQLWGASFDVNDSGTYNYGDVRLRYRSSATAISNSNFPLTKSYTDSSNTSTSDSRYYATETGILAFGNGRYWRAGRTYKWIAVWAPTT